MEITHENPLSPGANVNDKVKSDPASVELEENGNIAVKESKKIVPATDGSRPVDKFFSQQSRGEIPSPIKPGSEKNDATTESMDLKLDESGLNKADTTHVQPEDLSDDFTDMLEVNILEASADSKLDMWQTDLLSDSATSRKRPQTEMEPAVFEVPRMSKHPHTDSPPVPEFRDDSEPLIQFSSDSENVFRVALQDGTAQDSVEPMSFQEASQVQTSAETTGEALHEITAVGELKTTFTKNPTADDKTPRAPAPEDPNTDAEDTETVTGSDPETQQNPPSLGLSLLMSIDEALDPLARAIYPCIQRKPGFNTAFICIPLVVASLLYFYFRN